MQDIGSISSNVRSAFGREVVVGWLVGWFVEAPRMCQSDMSQGREAGSTNGVLTWTRRKNAWTSPDCKEKSKGSAFECEMRICFR